MKLFTGVRSMKSPGPKDADKAGLRTAGMLLAIPSLLIAAPLVGLFLGRALDRWLNSGLWCTAIGVGLGFFAAGREIYLIIRRVQSEEEGNGRR
ncbi:MAG: AtpZ/AtpI family protein [Candidatus Eisenbacteria bacterium]|uniref:AtpZ/AtpI family protein n=1 Tax=Eiseniibacteriota bacterium TaxID=2212470 RepID=A0A849SMV9_UNCEI|nr:AtpZ/AtpI family protein [Candidatus Eisenbacteria bacterium]